MKLLSVLRLAAVVVLADAIPFYHSGLTYDKLLLEQKWEDFKIKHHKHYSPQEDKERFENFMNSYDKLRHHIAYGSRDFELELNQFSDWSQEEQKRRNGYLGIEHERPFVEHDVYQMNPNADLPEALDWRNRSGVVTAVKDQGQCGSCWAFSSTGALEGMHALLGNSLVSLSESNLVDCSDDYGNDGCSGGLMTNAFTYVQENDGIDTEKSYPYRPVDEPCRYKNSTVGAVDTGYVVIPQGDEEALKHAVATVGPISVAIDAGHPTFQMYKKGVYYEPSCSSSALDHGVLLVGYGTDEQAGDYWLVKNSWGASWGDRGYIKMARNKDNNCGIATMAAYPVDKQSAAKKEEECQKPSEAELPISVHDSTFYPVPNSNPAPYNSLGREPSVAAVRLNPPLNIQKEDEAMKVGETYALSHNSDEIASPEPVIVSIPLLSIGKATVVDPEVTYVQQHFPIYNAPLKQFPVEVVEMQPVESGKSLDELIDSVFYPVRKSDQTPHLFDTSFDSVPKSDPTPDHFYSKFHPLPRYRPPHHYGIGPFVPVMPDDPPFEIQKQGEAMKIGDSYVLSQHHGDEAPAVFQIPTVVNLPEPEPEVEEVVDAVPDEEEESLSEDVDRDGDEEDEDPSDPDFFIPDDDLDELDDDSEEVKNHDVPEADELELTDLQPIDSEDGLRAEEFVCCF